MIKDKSKILVIGESCKDIFIYCDANRLCPDIPVPVLSIKNKTENEGMAKNVQRNIKSFMDCDILTNNNWEEISKTRYVHNESNHMFIRIDTPHNIEKINLKNINYNYDIIIIADYNKGFLSESDIELICENHPLVFLDTKKILGNWAKKAKIIKINNHEYLNSEKFIDNELFNLIIRTKGSEGCYYQGNNIPVINKLEVKDTSGAGDSFMAALVVKYYETKDIKKSIIYANECASKVVSQKGVTII